MAAVYGNLMVTGIAVALFVATLNLGKRAHEAEPPPGKRPVSTSDAQPLGPSA